MLPESVFTEFPTNENMCIVGNLYRQPNGCIDYFLFEVENSMHGIVDVYSQYQVFIMTGFKVDFFKVDANTRFLDYFSLVISFGYFVLTLRPTRVTTHCCSLIDKIWTNAVFSIDTSGVIYLTFLITSLYSPELN